MDDSTQLADRMAVLLTSSIDGSTKLLGVPKLVSESGKSTADVVNELLDSWEARTYVFGMCFDRSASNTGLLWCVCASCADSGTHSSLDGL